MAMANDPADKKSGAQKSGEAGDKKGATKLKDPNDAHEILEVPKNVPQARFGHTITMVNKYKVVLFGGATGDTGKYSMTGETFMFNMLLRAWTELNGKYSVLISFILSTVKGVPPSPRAAHASTNVEQM
jgi:protein phosphatase